jgi:hypothetical protein
VVENPDSLAVPDFPDFFLQRALCFATAIGAELAQKPPVGIQAYYRDLEQRAKED